MENRTDRPLVFAVDFDGTIAHTQYPKIISENKRITDFMKKVKADGHQIIVWTCREGDHLLQAKEWMCERGIPFDKMNESIDAWVEFYGPSRKVGADYYIDDKAINVHNIGELESLLYQDSEIATTEDDAGGA